jgi:hypothetical protein
MADELVPIATFVTPAQAAAARCALEAQGIASFLKDDNLVGMNWLLGNAVGYVKLLVSEPDVQRARELLHTPFDDWPAHSPAASWTCRQCGEEGDGRFDRCQHCGQTRNRDLPDGARQEAFMNNLQNADDAQRRAENPYASPRSDVAGSEADDSAESDDADPGSHVRCPGCDKPRMAVCPFCRTSGTRFRSADTFGDTAEEEPLLLCPTCDEPFEATYLRTCEWCGHDFGSGVQAPEIVKEFSAEPLNGRVLLVGLGGVALVAGLVIYFARLLR